MANNRDELNRIRRVYQQHYSPGNSSTNDLWHPLNPVSMYYRQSQERAIASLFRKYPLLTGSTSILDLGCGTGGFLRYLASIQVPWEQITGLDLLFPRLQKARAGFPTGSRLVNANGAELPFPAGQFDLVSQFTVFSSILDDRLRQDIARSLDRVMKPGSHLIWYDLQIRGNDRTQGLEFQQVAALFPEYRLVTRANLHPPFATRIARKSIILCDLLEKLTILPRTHLLLLMQKV